MLTGEILALLLAVFTGFIPILIRKCTMKSDPKLGVFISLMGAPPLLFTGLVITGEWTHLINLNYSGFLFFSLAGITHFLLGRTLHWYGIQIVGASRASVVARSQIIFSPLLALIILAEGLGVTDIFAAVAVLIGAILISLSTSEYKMVQKRRAVEGIVASLSASMLWGASPIMIKMGLAQINSPLIGTFIASSVALLGYAALMWGSNSYRELFSLDRTTWYYIIGIALLSPAGILLRFAALADIPVVTFIVIASLGPLFTLFFSYIFIKRLELLNYKVGIATVLMVLGAVLAIM